MSILIPKANKQKIVALLRELSREVIYQHLLPEQVQAVEGQCAWMADNKSGDMTIKAMVGSDPLTHTVSFQFDLIFTPAPIGPGQ